jgi:hypothetical protein
MERRCLTLSILLLVLGSFRCGGTAPAGSGEVVPTGTGGSNPAPGTPGDSTPGMTGGTTGTDGGDTPDGGAAACAPGAPTKLASSHVVTKIVVDGSDLYFLDIASAYAGVYRMPAAGGTPVLISSVAPLQNDGAFWDFAVDDRAVYVTYYQSYSEGLSTPGITIVDKLTGSSRVVHPTASGCTGPVVGALAALGGSLWFIQINQVGRYSGCAQAPFRTIELLSPGATASHTIASVGNSAKAILVDSSHVFVSDESGTFRMGLDGSTREPLAPVSAEELVSDGSTLFVGVAGRVDAITAPGQVTTVFSPDPAMSGGTVDIAVDDAHLYAAGGWGIIRADKTGANPSAISNDRARAVAVDATHAYYFTGLNLMETCK